MAHIHPTAIVEAGAELDADVVIGPYTVIGPEVRIGAGTTVGAHCVIEGRTTIGRSNRIFQFNSIGAMPQDMSHRGEPTELRIGDRNTIREFCTFNAGTVQGGGVTRVGDDNWIMAYVHIAHDCHVANKTIFANGASLAGHVTVDDLVIFGGFTGVHQFCRIGAHVITAASSLVLQDVPPYLMVAGNTAQPYGIHGEGLKRRGFTSAAITELKRAYRTLYKSGLLLEEAKVKLAEQAKTQPDVQLMVDFLEASKRGIIR